MPHSLSIVVGCLRAQSLPILCRNLNKGALHGVQDCTGRAGRLSEPKKAALTLNRRRVWKSVAALRSGRRRRSPSQDPRAGALRHSSEARGVERCAARSAQPRRTPRRARVRVSRVTETPSEPLARRSEGRGPRGTARDRSGATSLRGAVPFDTPRAARDSTSRGPSRRWAAAAVTVSAAFAAAAAAPGAPASSNAGRYGQSTYKEPTGLRTQSLDLLGSQFFQQKSTHYK